MTATLTIIILLSILATYIWRFTGVLVSRHIDPQGTVFEWVSCVAYAMLAGLMARVLIYPAGVLEETLLTHRLIAMTVGLVVFIVLRKNFFAAASSATLSFYCLMRFLPAGL